MSAAHALKAQTMDLANQAGSVTDVDDFSWRVLALLNAFRTALGLLLLAVLLWVQDPRVVGESNPELALFALLGLTGFGVVSFALLRRRHLGLAAQTYLQYVVDLACIVTLLHASGGISSGLGGLLVVSVGSLALLVPADRALMLAALSTIALLAEQSVAQLQGLTGSAEFAPAGILGAVIFVIVSVVQTLRRRIVETEALAEQRGVDLRNLVELNEYIIQHLRESIVVVDGDDRVRLINESATKHLGASSDAGQPLGEANAPLALSLDAWRADGSATKKADFDSADGSTRIQPHFAPLGSGRSQGVVIFLEDTSLIAERVQQAKLAALGRLSASIAHEIRNPLGALSHAGQLLAESDSMGPDDHRLTDIIRINSKRVSQIVDSVLALSRRDTTKPERILLRAWAEDFADEFIRTQELYEGTVTVGGSEPEIVVEMDPTHLHQVLWNLCDNAVKYASATAGAIAVEVHCGHLDHSARPYIEVVDRGPGVEPDQVEHIFEPFFTAQPGGTGLGLYISRELCERNGATLRYQPRDNGGSVFRIVFADPSRWQASKEIQ
jgi:two-component system sensor histidine kinase PilS (NtrC family)